MSFIQSARCVRLKCPGVAKNVLLALADMANDAGYAWPTIETLCMRTDWGKRAVIDAIAWLEANGAIRPDRTNGRKTVYWLTPDNYTGERHPEPGSTENRCAKRTGAPDAPVHVAHGTGAPNALNRCAKRTLTIKNHQEPNTPQPPADAEGAPGFDAIAAKYPRRARIVAARREWDRLAPDAQLQAEIARAITAWIPSAEWQRDGGRYVPRLDKFLADQRWLDAPGAAAAASAVVVSLPPVKLTPEQLQANAERARAVREALGLAQRKAVAA